MKEYNNKNLTIDELKFVQEEVNHKGKKLSLTYMLTLFLGLFGVHRAYLDKYKSAVLRAVLTISTMLSALALVANKDIVSSGGTISMEDRAFSSTLMLLFSVLVFINISWTLIDLFLIPKWIEKNVKEIENKATDEAIMSRHVSEHLRKDLLSKVLIEDITKDVSKKVNNNVETLSKEVSMELSEIKDNYISLRNSSSLVNDDITNEYKDLLKSTEEFKEIVGDTIDSIDIDLIVKDIDKKIELIRDEAIASHTKAVNEEIKALSADTSSKDESTETSDDYGLVGVVTERKDLHPEEIDDENGMEAIPESLSTIIDDDIKSFLSESREEILTVKEAIYKNSGHKKVGGYIIGYVEPSSRTLLTEEINGDTNIVISDTPNHDELDNSLVAKLSWNSGLRKEIGLGSNPEIISRKIILEGELEEYFGRPGMIRVDKASLL